MIARSIFLLYVMIFLIVTSLSAQTYTVAGYIIDKNTKETIIGVNIVVRDHYKGAATDRNGFFSVSGLSAGKYIFEISHIGYQTRIIDIEIEQKSILLDDIVLLPEILKHKEIVVAGKRSEFADPDIEPAHQQITPVAIKSIPTIRGDIFKALKYLPGIEGIDPISPLYSVRGSDPGENLVLLDGVRIYNPYHYVTSSGLFNVYALKNVEMLTGGFGAEYGGVNSSILYLTTREGNSEKLHGEIEPSTSYFNTILDFPVSKNATMMISGRIFYDLVSRFLFYSPNYFYDMNISLNWKLNKTNRLQLRYFLSKDYIDYNFRRFSSYFATTFDTDVFDEYDVFLTTAWYNQAATAILKTIISPIIYLKNQVAVSFFSSKNLYQVDFEYLDEDTDEQIKLFYKTDIRNKIRDVSSKHIVNIIVNSTNTVNAGLEYNNYFFSNDIIINYFNEGKVTKKPYLLAGFIEDQIKLGHFSVRPGIRFSYYSYMDKIYHEPRLSTLINLASDFRIKAAWGNYYQYITSINSNEYELSQYLDNYYPLKVQKPSSSTHYIVGAEKSISDNAQLSIDLYYKHMSRLYAFDYHVSELEAYHFSDKIKPGSGKSYGIDLIWKGRWQNFSGWISYGISKSSRNFPYIMEGKQFLFDYDRTHCFKAVVNHQIHPSLSYSGTLRVLSGVPKTLGSSTKSYYYYDPFENKYSTFLAYTTEDKNNIRLPLFIKLDFGLKKKIRKGFAAELAEFLGAEESYLNISIGNILFLFHRNVWFYIETGNKKLYAVGTNYFPEFSIGYTIKF